MIAYFYIVDKYFSSFLREKIKKIKEQDDIEKKLFDDGNERIRRGNDLSDDPPPVEPSRDDGLRTPQKIPSEDVEAVLEEAERRVVLGVQRQGVQRALPVQRR